jgi:hypothetical protein
MTNLCNRSWRGRSRDPLANVVFEICLAEDPEKPLESGSTLWARLQCITAQAWERMAAIFRWKYGATDDVAPVAQGEISDPVGVEPSVVQDAGSGIDA